MGSGTEQSVPGPVFYEGSGCKSQSVFSPLYDRGKKCAIIIFEIFNRREKMTMNLINQFEGDGGAVNL